MDNQGWTNLVLEANEQIILRFPRRPEVARSLGGEIRLLEILGRDLSVPVPHPLRIAVLGKPAGWPFVAYRKLPGTPLADFFELSRPEKARLTRFLVRMFSELSDLPPAPLKRMGILSGDKISWREKYDRLERRYPKGGAHFVPPSITREVTRLFRAFSETLAKSHYAPVLLHHDLWPSHILWDGRKRIPTGVIDWEGARFGDPAFDLTALRGLGPALDEVLIRGQRTPQDTTFEKRLLFYRRIGPLGGLLYGLESGRTSIVRIEMRRLRASLRLESLKESSALPP